MWDYKAIMVTLIFLFTAKGATAAFLKFDHDRTDTTVIKILASKLKFDKQEFYVKAGEPVKLILSNEDVIRHNLLIVAPGSLEEVGAAADKLATTPQGRDVAWVPDMPEILFATPLIGIGETFVLKFTAPEKKGKYPFVCTFPQHWRMMNGIMEVIE
ncbi:plastocyanin/azurin family copper-binding protein [Fulvivirgaceae bacterium BMA10]|uniref:Plastocyanin/azurin family copper-binding protein n=1 Tax=Splendidivirga corallicola TaxID=3051826 RepID=A0ABT8KRX2_9BACT|nr:plastocyanin/azurin family copper-binding protein [Fulvivirgaceae bacterium BMA10]